VPINIVDLLEAVQVQKNQSVDGAFARGSRSRSSERVIELTPIGHASQRILKSECAYMLLCDKPASGFAFLLNVPSHREGQQYESHDAAEKQSLIKFDGPLMHGYAIGVLEDVVLKYPVEPNDKGNDEDEGILENGTVSNHEAPHARQIHHYSPKGGDCAPAPAKKICASRQFLPIGKQMQRTCLSLSRLVRGWPTTSVVDFLSFLQFPIWAPGYFLAA
jgi:hypothetical protein